MFAFVISADKKKKSAIANCCNGWFLLCNFGASLNCYRVVTNSFQVTPHHFNWSISSMLKRIQFKPEMRWLPGGGTSAHEGHFNATGCQLVHAHTSRLFRAASQQNGCVFVLWAEAENLERTHAGKGKPIGICHPWLKSTNVANAAFPPQLSWFGLKISYRPPLPNPTP